MPASLRDGLVERIAVERFVSALTQRMEIEQSLAEDEQSPSGDCQDQDAVMTSTVVPTISSGDVAEQPATIETLREEMAAMRAASEASMQKLSGALAQMQGQLATLQPKQHVISDEDAGYDKPESLFAYCMEMVVKPDLPALDYVRVALFLLTLTAAQYVLIFAFFDAVWWDAVVGRYYPAFKEAVEVHNFYVCARPKLPDCHQSMGSLHFTPAHRADDE